MHFMHGNELAIFVMAGLSIVPLAALISASTEELAKYLGSSLGALLNATFGNAAELILTITALAAGELVLVRAAITGAIVANILLGLGMAMVFGGLRHHTQRFKEEQAELLSTMLFIATIAILTPSMFEVFFDVDVDSDPAPSQGLVSASLLLSGALLGLYVLSLVFSFITHKHYLADDQEHEEHPHISRNAATILLLVSTVVMAWQTDVLIDALNPTVATLGLSKLFAGVIFLPLIGGAGEYFACISAALKNKMGMAAGIAIGASNQIIFFVLPVLIFLSLFLRHPMPFVLNKLEILAIAFTALIASKVTSDGTTNWLEGAQFIVIWAVLGVAFFYLAGKPALGRLLGLRSQAQVGLQRFPALRELPLGLLVAHRRHDDDVLTLLPVHRRRHPVGVGELERVDHTQDLVEVAPGRLRVGDHQPDLLLRIDHEHRPDRVHLVVGRMHHAVEVRHLPLRIRDDRKVRRVALGLADVLRPAAMGFHRVDGQADRLDAPPLELRLEPGHVAQLGGADRGEVTGMREEDGPAVADPVVEADGAGRGLRGEVRSRIAQSQSHIYPLVEWSCRPCMVASVSRPVKPLRDGSLSDWYRVCESSGRQEAPAWNPTCDPPPR
jgi:Ca2+:H+ antiporter